MVRIRRNRVDRDYIGKLPDCVLNHIVSLIPYKEAARTATLSTRWHRLLPSSRVMDFDEKKLGFRVPGESGFVGFSKELMKNYREARVDKFSLALNLSSPVEINDELRAFISFAADMAAKVMLLDFYKDGEEINKPKFDLPRNVYANSSLESLKLYSCNFDPFGFKNFPSLIDVSLGFMSLPPDALLSMVQKCPALKSLSLIKCVGVEIFVIKGRVLERLVMEDCGTNTDNCWIDVQTPNLKFFKYSGDFSNFEFYVTERLEEVVFDFKNESEFGFGPLVFELFRCNFTHVKALTVCSYVLQTIASGEEPLGILGMRVKHLTLKTAMHANEFFGIRFFLYSCPSLHTLDIEIDPTRLILEDYEAPFEENWADALPYFTCINETLKVVNVKGYSATNDERCFMAYLLAKARILKVLSIQYSGGSRTYHQLSQMLQIVQPISPNLKITISATN